jgi:7-keto-8-aminopelargonate synthetase-like enzyme
MRRITSAATAAVLALALAAGACGGGSDDTAKETSKDTSTEGTATTSGGSSGGTASGSPDLSGLVPEECQFLLAGAFLNPLAFTQPGASTDLSAEAEQLDAIAAKAPAEIRDAMKTIQQGFAKLAETLKDVDLTDPQSYADPDVAAKLQELDSVFNDADYDAASQKVSDYVDQNCSG